MDNEHLLREILEVQKKQLAVLSDLLEQSENNNKKYRDYLVEQKKTNDDYRESLEKSSVESYKKDSDRLEEHQAYMRGATVARITNYVRMVSSVCLVGLVGRIAIYGLGS